MNKSKCTCMILLLPLLICYANSVHAQSAPGAGLPDKSSTPLPEADPVSDLMRVLDEETEIATRTKLNVDFVPGMVTVLHGKDLLAKGVRTVYEALGLVPGVELSMTGDGQYQFLVRGMGKAFASTKTKFLINGVDVNSTLGPVATVRTIPIEQVDRIEVVRGPGSAIYGEYALAGVVDVITIEQGNTVFARYGDVDGGTLGATYGYHPAASKFGFSFNFSGTSTGGGDVTSGKDKLSTSAVPAIKASSNAPGASNERESNNAAMLKMNYADLSLYIQHVRSAFGDHFGVNDALPDESTKLVRRWDFDTVEVRNPWRIGSEARAEVRVGWTHFLTDVSGQQLFPAGFPGFAATGVIGGPHYEETRRTIKSAFEFPLSPRHYGVGGIEYADVRQGDTWNERNYSLTSTGTGFVPVAQIKYQGAENWLKEGLKRRIVSAYFQDQYTGLDKTTVTAGLRVDHYNDVGNAVTPRIGAVYQLSSRQTLKLQYSDAFRPPSFLEMYSQKNPVVNGNPEISPERLHNLEAGYAYNSGQYVFRATAFHSDIHHIIVIDTASKIFHNGGEAHIRGLELEGVVPLARNLKIDGNVSVQNSNTQEGLSSLWGAAQRLANLGVLYQANTDRYINVQYRYTGARERETADTRAVLEGYQTADFTVSADKIWLPALSLRAGVRNIFDADVRFPAPKATYPDDYPRPGRQWWLAANYDI
ncbi:MAG: TonB-dependent receptor [Gammaproteobacteria bacterium]|nr:TonB-dependent receptor [Gammaproteobacteria bacterium]